MKSFNCSAQYSLVKEHGGEYPISGFQITYSVNGIPSATVDMAIGRKGTWKDESSQDTTLKFEKGDVIKIYAIHASFDNPYAKTGTYVLFTGSVYDMGPSPIEYGAFSIRIVAFGRLSWLNSGTLQSNAITSKSMGDFGTVADFLLVSGTSNYILDSEAMARTGLFNELTRVMKAIATDTSALQTSLTEFINAEFGGGPNKLAADIIDTIKSDSVSQGLRFRQVLDDANQTITNEFVNGVWEMLNGLFANDAEVGSFMERMLTVGDLTNAVLVETAGDILYVPAIPFFKSTGNIKTISGDSYSSISNSINSSGVLNNYMGCVLVAGDGRVGSGPGADGLVAGLYNRARGSSLSPFGSGVFSPGSSSKVTQGVVLTLPAPPVMSAAIGLGDFYQDTQNGKNLASIFSRKLGDNLAKLLCWLKMYEHDSYTVSCPFLRTDIGPGTPVRVLYPQISEIQAGVGTASIYGFVQSVTIAVSAQQASAVTSYEIGYARSHLQQGNEIDPNYDGHPIYDSNWPGHDLFGRKR